MISGILPQQIRHPFSVIKKNLTSYAQVTRGGVYALGLTALSYLVSQAFFSSMKSSVSVALPSTPLDSSPDKIVSAIASFWNLPLTPLDSSPDKIVSAIASFWNLPLTPLDLSSKK